VLYTEGKIVVPNPYDPDNPSVFRDWKNHGAVDMREALAQSSDVYFYEVGGGFERQKGMGISNIEKYGRMFGFGQDVGSGFFGMQKGTIPNPVWKAETFDGEAWRVGNTYHSVIGQYGWQVTPLQAARGIAAIANYGTLVKPTILKNDRSMSEQASTIDIPRSYFDVVHEGMRRAVVQGTITNLNMSEVEVAAKTGTAQIGVNNSHYNSWAVGFFPYKNPKYAFAIVMEKGVLGGTVGAPAVAREFFDQMIEHAPEYIHPL
jgi:penicillin-binding protein 2